MLYPQYFIDDLKSRADLVRLIQPYAPDLKKKGANWMACCPFHQEKTPSFSVNPSKGFYKCFGCGKGGTAFNFVMEMEGLNFPEAVKRVAEFSGVMLPEPIDDASYARSKKKREEKKQLADQVIELNQVALDHWEKELQGKSKEAKAARAYLDSRGIAVEIREKFRIGFAPDSWDDLLSVLRDFGADEKLIAQSGLVSVNEEKDRTFDRFRGRIIFPVLDVDGRPVAFGARSLDPEDQPKYLNSPETPAYVKGEHLYGLFQSKDDIRKRKFAILVEGYLDLIALAQYGIPNVTASLGTAFTDQQAKLLNRFTRQAVINYDGDRAGIDAARKAVFGLLGRSMEVKVFVLPENQDPDDFVRIRGSDEYERMRSDAQWWYDFFTDPRVLGHKMSTPHQRAEAAEQLLTLVQAIPNPTERSTTLDQVLTLCAINDPAARRELTRSVAAAHRSAGKAREVTSVDRSVRRVLRGKITFAERRLLELLVHDADLRDTIIPLLEPSDYENLATAELFEAFVAIHTAKQPIRAATLAEHLGGDEEMLDLAHKLLSGAARREKEDAIDEIQIEAENCLFALRDMAIASRITELSREAALAEQAGNSTRAGEIVLEQLKLEKVRRELKAPAH